MDKQLKLFWFSKIGTKDSFSRIAEAILPILKKNYGYQLYTIIPPTLTLETNVRNLFEKDGILRMGSDIDEGGLNLRESEFMGPMKRNLGSQMKYITLQVLAHCQSQNISTLMITMGVYEANWFMEAIENIRGTKSKSLLENVKIVLYVPFDYIPSEKAIKYLVKADLVITTVPYMVEKLREFGTNVDWVGHACSSEFKNINRKKALKLMNAMNGRFWKGNKIKPNDIVILNANLYGSRKRIEATIKAFNLVSKGRTDLRLWLHGGATRETIDLVENKEYLIISSKVKSSELNLIYNVCQIGLQTSWGEGWSLTNCEHATVGGLQVVPDWLACGFHFKDLRGILVGVNKVKSVNEANKKVTIGVPDQKLVEDGLQKAIDSFKEYDPSKTVDYMKSYTWESAAKKINLLLFYKF